MKDLAPSILNTIQISPELLARASVYFNKNEGYNNLFAEHRLGREQVYFFTMYDGLYALDTAELQHVFGIKKLTAPALRRLPIDYLAEALRHSRQVYRSYFKDDICYPPNISWIARATALAMGANVAEAKRYMHVVDVAFGCLGYRVDLVAEGILLRPRDYEVQPTSMQRNLTSLANLGLLTFIHLQDNFVVRLAHEHLTNLDAVLVPRFLSLVVY